MNFVNCNSAGGKDKVNRAGRADNADIITGVCKTGGTVKITDAGRADNMDKTTGSYLVGDTDKITNVSKPGRTVRKNRIWACLFALMLLSSFVLAGCSGNTPSGPKTMPAPDANAGYPATPGPAIQDTTTVAPTPSLDADAEVTGTDGDNTTTDIPHYIVVLDPGHGGNFIGAWYDDRIEKNLTLTMANYIKDYLLENYDGIEIYFTRDTDVALNGDIKIDLEQRAEVAKQHNADYFVSLHFNASEEHQLHGTTVYASFRDNVAEKSQGIAASILEQLVALGLKDNAVKTRKSQDYYAEDGSRLDYYAVIRHSAARDIPGVIVEHCFMDNEIDKQFMNTDEKLMQLAIADAEGLAKYLQLPKKGV